MAEMVKNNGSSMLSPSYTLLVSSLEDFTNRALTEMLASPAEIEERIKLSPYNFTRGELDGFFKDFKTVVIPMLNELEALGFRDFWKETRLPLILKKCGVINGYFEKHNIKELIEKYKKFGGDDVTVYLCSFARPHGIKLCGYRLISDFSYRNETILSNVTHELFHPPYDRNEAAAALNALAAKDWVVKAFESQDPHSGYPEMMGFIEENIVEALGIYIAYLLGAEKEPYEYFRRHDGGSHVISPYFFKYLTENETIPGEEFIDYFNKFVAGMDC
jgi:hypothetical protein